MSTTLEEERHRLKRNILGTVHDLVANFLYYDRKNDDELPAEMLNQAFWDGVITPEEIVEEFEIQLLLHTVGIRQKNDEGHVSINQVSRE